MREIAHADYRFERREMDRSEAISFLRERDERFKVEILEGIDAPRVSLYEQGEFVDLCRGPHVPSTGRVKHFKLLSSSGAYWRGSEKNPMLQRIYGTAWLTAEDLGKYLLRLGEGEKRDPPKLRRQVDPFDFFHLAPPAPLLLPHRPILLPPPVKVAPQ